MNNVKLIFATIILTAAVLVSAYAIVVILDDDNDHSEDTGPYYTISFQVVSSDEAPFPRIDGNLTDPGTRLVFTATYDATTESFVLFGTMSPTRVWSVSIEFNNLEPMEEYNIRIGFSPYGINFYIVPTFQDTFITSCEEGKISLSFFMRGGSHLGDPFIIGFGAPKSIN
ncbi:MAG: hypothetical protein FWD92_06985 [Methanomassiliicoccaceae archaeon]|nr:hypothetical protein [Methanomassiliicoccaceae archaeon]